MVALTLSIHELAGDFPTFRVAVAALRGLRGGEGPNDGIETLIAAAEAEGQALVRTQLPAELPEIQAWRAAYRAFGSKKTGYRNSCEALLRRLAQQGTLPRVSPLVDLYNALSVKYRIPAGADDLAKLAPPLAFRTAREGDSFFDLANEGLDDPPRAGEVVYADSEKCLCRRWNWRQDARSRVTAETRDAVVVLQTLEEDGTARLTAAAEELACAAADHLGARCSWAIASAATPQVTLDVD
jgi:DNA/RNA-binding domain of Phe-tRNA-synthetase-like protein